MASVLACHCSDSGDWWYYPPEWYTTLSAPRWRKCCSCGARVNVGDVALEFPRARATNDWSVESRIYGDEKPLAPYWMCESCGDQYFNLSELGFCIELPSDMRALLREYAETYGRGRK